MTSHEIALTAADLALVERLRADLHQRNGELLVARMELDMLRDDVRQVVSLLPQSPGAALSVLIAVLDKSRDPV